MNPPTDPDPSADPPQQAPLVEVEPGEVVLRAEPVDRAPAIEYLTPRPQRSRWFVPLLLGACAAIGLFIAGVVVPLNMTDRGGQARSVGAKTDVANLQTALDAFEIDNGRYPTQAEGLQALITPPRGASNWHGPYVRMVPTDPWGMPYIYQFPGKHKGNPFDLSSYGPDKKLGSDDIVNWRGP